MKLRKRQGIPECFIRDSREVVTEAVRVPPVGLSNKVVRSRVLAKLLEEQLPVGVLDTGINVQMTTATNLIREGHFIANMHILKKAVFRVRHEVNGVRRGAHHQQRPNPRADPHGVQRSPGGAVPIGSRAAARDLEMLSRGCVVLKSSMSEHEKDSVANVRS